MKIKRFIVVVLFLIIRNFSIAQHTFSYYDSLTYRLYNENKWDSVIYFGQKSVNEGFDYYYLRMRIGIAHYSTKQYSQSIEHFLKAKEFNSNEIVNEYIYYSYLLSGQLREAYYFTKQMNEASLKKNHLTTPHFIDMLGIEVDNSQFNDWNSIKKNNTPPSEPNNYRLEKEITGPFFSYGINLKFNLSKNWSWDQQFTFFEIDAYQQLYFDNTIKHEHDFNLYETHHYTSFTHWGKNHSIRFFAHLSQLNANKFQYTYINPILAPPPFPPVTTYNYKIDSIKYSLFNYIIGIQKSIYKSKSSFNYMINFSKIIDNNVLIGGLNFDYRFNSYFFGNTSVLASVNLSHNSFNGYIEQGLGAKIFNKIIFNILFDFGKIQNITNIDGSIVYNTPYIIHTKLTPQIRVEINKHLSINAAYIFQKSTFTNNFIGFDGMSMQGKPRFKDFYETYKFNNQIISGGLLWKF